MNLGLSLGLGGVRAAGGGAPTGPLDFIGYGQSNWLFHTTNQTDRPAANADTFVWNPDTNAWVTPVGNGVRTFLNAMQAATGRVCRLVSGGQSGVPIGSLQKGTQNYTDLLARISASGINPACITFHQGEGNATAGTALATHQAALNTLHTDICADLGKTPASLPLILSSLGTLADAQGAAENAQWDTIQRALATINSAYPNIYYSHSNVDAALADSVHWDGPSYGRSGARYAQTVQFLMGMQSTRPRWYATAAERYSTTETDITVVHDMGDDFTPTTGITGFEVSDDNGASWEAATGARIDATKIRLTHSDMGTVKRLVRYHYGANPDITAPVLDNSALVNPLNFTIENLVAEGAVALPSITWAGSVDSSTTNANQGATGIAVPGSTESVLAIVGITGSPDSLPTSVTVTAQPSGTAIAANQVVSVPSGSGSNPNCRIYQAVLPTGTTSINIAVVYPSNPFQGTRFHVSTIPVASLNSTTAVGTGTARTTASSTVSVDIETDAGGVIFAIASVINATSGTTGTMSGDATFATRNSNISRANTHIVADASNVAEDAASTVTATFTNAGNIRVTAASWR